MANSKSTGDTPIARFQPSAAVGYGREVANPQIEFSTMAARDNVMYEREKKSPFAMKAFKFWENKRSTTKKQGDESVGSGSG